MPPFLCEADAAPIVRYLQHGKRPDSIHCSLRCLQGHDGFWCWQDNLRPLGRVSCRSREREGRVGRWDNDGVRRQDHLGPQVLFGRMPCPRPRCWSASLPGCSSFDARPKGSNNAGHCIGKRDKSDQQSREVVQSQGQGQDQAAPKNAPLMVGLASGLHNPCHYYW